jgi:hypothetical protein
VAAALSDIHDLSTYPPFVRRVTAAVIKAAIDIGAEPYTGTQEQIARRALSSKVLQESDYWGDSFADGVAANPEVTADSDDGEIQWTVNGLWNAYAGAYVETPTPSMMGEQRASAAAVSVER